MDSLQLIFPLAGVKTYLFIPTLVAFAISFFTSTAGISGAFLLLPFQMSVLGFTSPSVTSTNFLFNVTGTPGGVYRYIKECRFAWPLALIIVAGIIPGVLIGYNIRIRLLPDPKSFKFFVGLVLLFVALKLIRDAWSKRTGGRQNSCSLEERLDNVSLSLKKTGFKFGNITYSFSTSGILGVSFFRRRCWRCVWNWWRFHYCTIFDHFF
jgi:uncharacterized membrane protein YfcA